MAQSGMIEERAHHHRKAIRRGSFDIVKQLIAAVGTFIEGWKDRCPGLT